MHGRNPFTGSRQSLDMRSPIVSARTAAKDGLIRHDSVRGMNVISLRGKTLKGNSRIQTLMMRTCLKSDRGTNTILQLKIIFDDIGAFMHTGTHVNMHGARCMP